MMLVIVAAPAIPKALSGFRGAWDQVIPGLLTAEQEAGNCCPSEGAGPQAALFCGVSLAPCSSRA